MKDIDNLEIIQRALEKYGGQQKTAGEYRMVCCPFHADKTPSCGIYTRRDNPRAPLGWFNCLGCGARGGWNKFAKQIGAETIKEWDNKEKRIETTITKEEEENLLGETGMTIRKVLSIMDCKEAQPWPEEIPWRGFKGSLLAQVGGLIINDRFNDNVAALFPVKIGRKIRGAVKAIYRKRFDKQSSYLTMPGPWINSYGLFPYDYTKKLIAEKEYNFVILVEGPRDALRLLKLGIPAIAVLGANTIGKTKAMYILSLGVDVIYAMPDNDRGGAALWKNLKEKLCKKSTIKRLKLPSTDEEGNKIKIDPFSAPRYVINNLKQLLKSKHDWKP